MQMQWPATGRSNVANAMASTWQGGGGIMVGNWQGGNDRSNGQ